MAGFIPVAWKACPGKLRQKDCDASWTVKFLKANGRLDGTKLQVGIAIRGFGYQNHIGIDSAFRLIRTWMVTDAVAYEGARLRKGLLDKSNTPSAVWADCAYRSGANEEHLTTNGFVSRVHCKESLGRPMPKRTRRANAERSKVRSCVAHVFVQQKSRVGLFVRTIGIARATKKIGLADLRYNVK